MLENITKNKDLIVNALFILSFLFVVYKILSVTLLNNLRKKFNPYSVPDEEKDFDKIVKRKVEMLRSTGGLYTSSDLDLSSSKRKNTSAISDNTKSATPAHLKALYEDLNWGAGLEVKKIIKIFQRELNFNPNEANLRNGMKKIVQENFFIKWQTEISSENALLLLYQKVLLDYIVDEILQGKPHFIKKISHRLSIHHETYIYALQIHLLKMQYQSDREIYPQRILLKEISSSDLQSWTARFMEIYANELIKSPNSLHEILKENFAIADLVRPWNEITSDSTIDDALIILGCHRQSTLDEVKKAYKKISLEKHPDKIMAQKLPSTIEQSAVKQFQILKNAYDLILKMRPKDD